MRTVIYRGPHDTIEIHPRDGSILTVARDTPVEVDDQIADALLEQDTWTTPDANDDTAGETTVRAPVKRKKVNG